MVFAVVMDDDDESFIVAGLHFVSFSDPRNVRLVNDHTAVSANESNIAHCPLPIHPTGNQT